MNDAGTGATDSGGATNVAGRLWESPFTKDMGLEVHDGGGTLTLPYAERLTTAGGALHGGAVAALSALSAQTAVRAADPAPAATPSLISVHVTYARAARGPALTAVPVMTRRTRELGFCEVRLADQDGKAVAHASAALAEGRTGGAPAPAFPSPAGDPAQYDAAVRAIPFTGGRGLRVSGVETGRLEMSMDVSERNLDRDGTVHEGAVLTLLDAAGTTVAWTGERPSDGGATVALHAQILGTLPRDRLVARAEIRAGDEQMRWCEVSVLSASDGWLRALGTIVYRFA